MKLQQYQIAVEYTDCRGVRPPPHNECPGYDTKQCDGEVPVLTFKLHAYAKLNYLKWNCLSIIPFNRNHICLHTVKWFQVLLSNINNSI